MSLDIPKQRARPVRGTPSALRTPSDSTDSHSGSRSTSASGEPSSAGVYGVEGYSSSYSALVSSNVDETSKYNAVSTVPIKDNYALMAFR